MRMEKNATNKVGIVVLIAVVIALFGGGIYYLVTHKDSLNIDWKLTFPWSKKDKETTVQTATGEKIKKQEDVTFLKPDGITKAYLISNSRNGCNAYFNDEIKDENNQIILKYTVESVDKYVHSDNRMSCSLEIYRIQVDGYEVSGTSEITVKETESKTAELRLSKAELEKNELKGMENMVVYFRYRTGGDNASSSTVSKTIEFKNNKPPKNTKAGIKVDEISIANTTYSTLPATSLYVEYYKTVTDMDNTYIYFNMQNRGNLPFTTVVRVKKLLINGKIYDASDYKLEVQENSKELTYITIPKSTVSKVEKFTVAFSAIFTLNKDYFKYDKAEFKSVYAFTNEYTQELKG